MSATPVTSESQSLARMTAVVTGASSGIGRAIALHLGGAGANVLVHARASGEAARAVVAEIESLGGAAEVALCDLAEPSQQEKLVETAWNWRGHVDIWINNAGADVLTGPAADWSFEEKLAQLWKVDVTATVRLSRLAGERMKRSETPHAAILNMGWDQAETGMGGDSGEMFATAKGAIMAFSKSLARSLAPRVRVNCLAPGWIKTDWGEQASGSWQQRAQGESLLARWGTPEDVARTALFLVSPAAAFVTGQVIAVNGGWQRAD